MTCTDDSSVTEIKAEAEAGVAESDDSSVIFVTKPCDEDIRDKVYEEDIETERDIRIIKNRLQKIRISRFKKEICRTRCENTHRCLDMDSDEDFMTETSWCLTDEGSFTDEGMSINK